MTDDRPRLFASDDGLADAAGQFLIDGAVGDEDQVEIAHPQRAAGEKVVEHRRRTRAADGQTGQAEAPAQLARNERENAGQPPDRQVLHPVHA